MKKDLRGLTLAEIEKDLAALKQPKYRAAQVFEWAQKKRAVALDEMTNLPKELRQELAALYTLDGLKQAAVQESTDGTKKYLWELSDGQRVESVLLDDDGRKTICLSSQVGCKMGCLFCATAKLKFRRNLTAGEIVSQVLQIERENGPVSNIVYMGMGEPLDNYDNVLKSIHILNHPKGRQIGIRKIAISTCGLPPMIKELAKEKLPITLAVSLNASIDPLRSKLMPINNRYPLKEVISAVKNYTRDTGSRVTFEYVLIAGQNDTRQDAHGLIKLLKGMHTNVNLIAFNPFSGSNLHYPTNKVIKDFRWILEDSGLEVSQRFKRGQDINAACGQLAGKA